MSRFEVDYSDIGYKITSAIDGDSVVVDTFSTFNAQTQRIFREVVCAKEQAVRDGLIALGWIPPDAWQPIDTAPRDGKQIVLSDGRNVGFGHWYRLQARFVWDAQIGARKYPTYWQPLPAAPKESTE
jgi:hypothetical protein